MEGILTRRSESVVARLVAVDSALAELDQLAQDYKPTLGGERFLTDKELSEQLKISIRKLATMRSEGAIDFIKLDGKILYKESDILKLLEANYFKAWEQ